MSVGEDPPTLGSTDTTSLSPGSTYPNTSSVTEGEALGVGVDYPRGLRLLPLVRYPTRFKSLLSLILNVCIIFR